MERIKTVSASFGIILHEGGYFNTSFTKWPGFICPNKLDIFTKNRQFLQYQTPWKKLNLENSTKVAFLWPKSYYLSPGHIFLNK